MPRFVKIRCDHCRKEYEEQNGSVLKLQFQRSVIPQVLPIGDGTYYLCGDCEQELVYWLLMTSKTLEGMYPEDPNELPIPPMPKGVEE